MRQGDALTKSGNGKIAGFTEDERRQFREALQDLSKKMATIATTL